MKLKDIPHPCDSCFNMRPWNLHMNGDHDYGCSKMPPSKYGDPECDKYVETPVGNTEPLRRMMENHDNRKRNI